MAQVGTFARGEVIRVMPYGALVRLEDGSLGLVHISEVDKGFVTDISQYVAPHSRVSVKVIALKEGGRYEFSLKQAQGVTIEDEDVVDDFGAQTPIFPTYNAPSRAAFDEKLRQFLNDSGEVLGDIQRHNESKLRLRRK